jgi:hypothetical protein
MTRLQEEWARCREWIQAAAEPTGLYTIADVEKAIEAGEMHFWPGRHCAAVTEFVRYPNCKVLNIFAGGGTKGPALKELTRELEPALVRWARASDCGKIMAFGIKPGWTPVGERLGYRHIWTVMTKDVE